MKAFSWNVNGLRALVRGGNWERFLALQPDIFGLQETKARPEQLTESVTNLNGYHSFFTSPTLKKGYSGVALYSKTAPEKVEYGLGIEALDTEGRMITAHFKNLIFIAAYFPNGGGAPERFTYKLDFYDAFLSFVDRLQKEGKTIIFCGDVNVAHTAIDLANPIANEGTPGYRPEVREWIDEVEAHGFVDTFRALHPNSIEYSYWDMKTRARDRNVGWRIDYFFVNARGASKVKKAHIHSDIFGSDHCPVSIEFDGAL